MSVKKIYVGFIGIIVLIVAFIILATSWYTVDQSEQAVLITFGKPVETISEPGLKFKLPWPIQTVELVSREPFSLTVGYEEKNGETVEHTREAKMVTGDENIILVDMEVQWRISDPVAYLFNSQDPQTILYNAASASLRGVIGSSEVDDALTDGRAEIMNRVHDYLTELSDRYQLGIQIVYVNLQDVDLPTEEVSEAFRKVTDAREEKNTKINQANRYRNEQINVALGEKDAIISRAEGQKIERIETARGDVAKFNALYEEYVKNPEITKHRLILETLEVVLPGAKIYIMDDQADTVTYLPLQTLKGGSQ